MTWRTLPLDTVKAQIPYALVGGPFGSNLTTRDYVDEGVPVIRGNNLPADSSFNDDGYVFVSEKKADDLRPNTAFPGDLVFTQRGTLGQVGLIPREAKYQRYIISQSQMKLTVNPEIADPRFVYYFFRLPATVATVINQALTSGVPHINLGILKDFKISLPKPDAQRSIADILSAYDDLIENNRRRMGLLEEAARQLYREWFIRLRFPGHEHTRITNGVPEEWERRELEQCVSVLETGNRPKGGVSGISEGVPSIGAESIVGVGQFDFGQTRYVPEDYFSRLRKGVIRDRDVLVYKDGGRPGHFTPHVSMFGGGFPFDRMALNSHVYRVRGADPMSQEFLYYHLSSEPMLSWMNSAGSGAAIPGIARKDLLRLPVPVAPNRLMEVFTEVAATGITQILKLALANRKLQEARDLLLPRLMNGEIAI